MTTNDIDAIRKLADAATEGPWQAVNDPSDDGGYPELSVGVATGDETFVFEDMDTLRADAEFIAAARTLVPALCEEIEQLRPVIEAAQRWASVRSDRGSDGMEFHRACVALASAVDQLAAERARTQETHQ